MRTAPLERALAKVLVLAMVAMPELTLAQQSIDQNTPPPAQTTNTPAPTQTQPPQTPTPAQQAPTTNPPASNPSTPSSTTQQTTQPPNGTVTDPNQQPGLMPPINAGSQNLPPAPEQQPTAPTQTQTQTPPPQQPQTSEPVGTAAAEKAKTVGGIASRPTGSAIAPAKQHQVRSWVIKLGAIAAGGAALGLVYALSRSSPSHPPGTP